MEYENTPNDSRLSEVVNLEVVITAVLLQMELELVSQFCYLGDVIEVEGGVDGAVVARIRSAWIKFRQLQWTLIMRKLSLKVRGKACCMCEECDVVR